MSEDNVKDVTRYISAPTSQMLWGRAAGRCQFDGHNLELYKSPITQESVNIAQKAHIYSFSENGPRGWGQTKKDELNNVENLMLMCHGCHKLIDGDADGEKYSAALLKHWKKQHEERIHLVTGIIPEKKTEVVFYGSNIGDKRAIFNKDDAYHAIFPERYPNNESPIEISMQWSGEDKDASFWQIEEQNLIQEFRQQIFPVIKRGDSIAHFTLFALADMPLLMKLGTLLGDIVEVESRQLLRDPKGWKWQDYPDDFQFIVNEPDDKTGTPILVFSLSGKISSERISKAISGKLSIWEITATEDHIYNDNIRNPKQLSEFKKLTRKLLEKIINAHGITSTLHVFPSMAVSCCVEFGRLRMPKIDMPWLIYDGNDGFSKTITIS